MKFASLFSGGGGMDIGAIAIGLNPIWGIELEDKIAAVARNNNHPTITQDLLKVDAKGFADTHGYPDVLHASPVCKSFSNAKKDGKELQLDIDAALKTCEFIKAIKPKVFTLENPENFIIVRINDRGPYHKTRVLDLSEKAFLKMA